MRFLKKASKRLRKCLAGLVTIISVMEIASVSVLAAPDVQTKITNAANTIKGILSGIVVIVGICVSLFTIIKRMPDADNPQEKHELYKGIGRIWGLVAVAAACVWVLPWLYELFT